jgi:hypothetical protein
MMMDLIKHVKAVFTVVQLVLFLQQIVYHVQLRSFAFTQHQNVYAMLGTMMMESIKFVKVALCKTISLLHKVCYLPRFTRVVLIL